MAMEDTSGRKEAEAPGGLEKEERQSVQGYVAIKGTRNGLLLTLEPETPFSDLLTALSERLAEAPGFFRGASLAVDTTRRALQISERTQLEALLAYYHMSVTSAELAELSAAIHSDSQIGGRDASGLYVPELSELSFAQEMGQQ